MKNKLALVSISLIIIVSVMLAGCSGGGVVTTTVTTTVTSTSTGSTGGVSQADYDNIKNQLTQAQNSNADLQKQIDALKAQYQLTGLTTAQIVEKVIQNYHATHVYSKTDMFICGDMSSEVWNELKALGISSVIVIGNKDNSITDILQSDHAWVLADVGNGKKLALETTGGFVVTQESNPLYYRGWYFSSPTDLKNNNEWIREYNVRVAFRNSLNNEVNNAMTLYNNSANQAEADKYMLLYNELKELRTAQETILLQLKVQIDGLAKQL